MSSFSRNLTNMLGIAAGATAAYYAAQYVRRTAPVGGTRVIAHRGGPKYAPENTLAAFQHAIAVGATMLECDVHLTRDGEVVVIHDETLERTTNGEGWVMDKTLAELRALDAGNGERVPTLKELVELAKRTGAELLVEVKSPKLYPGIEFKVLTDLEDAGYLERCVLQSFDWDSLRRLRQLKPSARLGALYDQWQWEVSWPAADAEYVCPPAEMVLLNPGLVRTAHSEGRGVFVWFAQFENELLYRYLKAFGVDGLIADDPVAARQVVEE
jgi:glycerophosphoryl diester phosphodiesterase